MRYHARRFDGPVKTKFAKSKDSVSRNSAGVAEYPITVVARRGGVVDHWYWAASFTNLQGCRAKDRILLDWCHEDVAIGYADQMDASSGQLVLTGALVSVNGR